jgi:hypothetical protein
MAIAAFDVSPGKPSPAHHRRHRFYSGETHWVFDESIDVLSPAEIPPLSPTSFVQI